MSTSQNTQNKYWNRIGYVKIEMPDGSMKMFGNATGESSLDFKFEIEKFASNTVTEFTVSVYGLSMDNIKALTIWKTDEAYKEKRKIEVYAGYKDGGINSPLAQGFITNALPTPPPELALNFTCMGTTAIFSIVDEPVVERDKTIKEVIESIASLLKVKLEWKVEKPISDGKIKAFTIEGSVNNLFEKIKQSFNILLQLRADRLIAFDKDFYINGKPDTLSHKVDKEHGLLSLGNITLKGADITVRLNDRYQILDNVSLKSELIPSANGDYIISRIIHKGHLRGKEWITKLSMFRNNKK